MNRNPCEYIQQHIKALPWDIGPYVKQERRMGDREIDLSILSWTTRFAARQDDTAVDVLGLSGDLRGARYRWDLTSLGPKVTRIAMGIPVGSDLEFADEVTMMKSLENRREL